MKETNSEPKIQVEHHERWDKRITGALSMIVVGIVLFMNTTGNLNWSVWWEFLKFWPVFIISAGVQLMLSFSRTAKIIAEFIGFFLFLLMLFLAGVNTNSGIFANSNIPAPKMNSSFPFIAFDNFNTNFEADGGIIRKSDNIWKADQVDPSSLSLEIDHKVGVFELTDLATDNAYFNAMVTSNDDDDTFSLDVENKNAVIVAKLETEHAARFFWNSATPRYSYSLSPELETNLEISLGAGSGKINFTEANMVESLLVKSGAGEVNMDFAVGALPEKLDLEVGAGQMVLQIPAEAGFEIDYELGVGNISVEGYKAKSGLGVNSTLKSENWESATEKIQIKLKVGAGNFSLNFN